MLQLTDKIWIGNSDDEKNLDLSRTGIKSVLNVAVDLRIAHDSGDDLECMKVGLVDGPGNPLLRYYSAVVSLHTLVQGGPVLVCCHSGSRSLAVALMYLGTKYNRRWHELLDILREQLDENVNLPAPHPAHEAAFNKVNWKLLQQMIGD